MRYTRSLLLALVLAFVAARAFCADALEAKVTLSSVTAKPGQVVTMAVNLRNKLAPREPITITAQAEWEDEYGVTRTTSDSVTLNITQPVKVNRYKVAIPAPFDCAQDMLFDYMAGSTKIGGQPVTPTLSAGELLFDVNRTLFEGESVALEYALKAR